MTADPYTINWLGYNEKGQYGRIWGYLTMEDKRVFAFWGTKGGKMLFKRHTYTMEWMINQSSSKGYKQINPNHYELICPGFKADLEIWLTTAILSDQF